MCTYIYYLGHSEVLHEDEQTDINEEEVADISFVGEEYDDSYKQLCRENRKVCIGTDNFFVR